MDLFGRRNLELTKKKSFIWVSNRRKRCKLDTLRRHERWEFACFLTIYSIKTTFTCEDMKRILISESGIKQALKRRKILVPQLYTFDYWRTSKLLLIIAIGFHCWKPLKGMIRTSPVNQSLAELRAEKELNSTHDWCQCSLTRKSAQSKINLPRWLWKKISLWV